MRFSIRITQDPNPHGRCLYEILEDPQGSFEAFEEAFERVQKYRYIDSKGYTEQIRTQRQPIFSKHLLAFFDKDLTCSPGVYSVSFRDFTYLEQRGYKVRLPTPEECKETLHKDQVSLPVSLDNIEMFYGSLDLLKLTFRLPEEEDGTTRLLKYAPLLVEAIIEGQVTKSIDLLRDIYPELAPEEIKELSRILGDYLEEIKNLQDHNLGDEAYQGLIISYRKKHHRKFAGLWVAILQG